nr:hypothetical protein [Tanacetum cinerariifolium]
MTTVSQGISVEEIERVIAQRVANAIEAIAIYETKTNLARHKVPRAYTAWPINKKAHAGSLPLCNQTPATAKNEQTRTCYECGSLRHYKSECPIVKFHEHVDMIHGRPNKRQNTGRTYTARHGEKKHYGGSKPLCSKCNYRHDGPCAPKCHQCNRFGYLARMSVEEIERVVAQRVANAIKAIAMYETKTNLARKLMSQTEQQEEEVAENASNKRKWESNHNGSLSQQNKGHK